MFGDLSLKCCIATGKTIEQGHRLAFRRKYFLKCSLILNINKYCSKTRTKKTKQIIFNVYLDFM